MISRWMAAAIVAVAFLSVPGARAQSFINVLTGGTSGVYYPLGVAIGKIYGDKIPSVKTQVQATKASVENLILLQQGRGELAFTLGDSLKAAWEGDEEAGFKSKLDKLRTIGAIYPNYIQIVATAESGIKTLADLKGKSLSVGAPKSGTELNSRAILAAAGMTLQGHGQGRISAVRRIRRPDEEPPAQRDAAIGRPRRRLAEGPLDLDRHHGGRRCRRRSSTRSARPSWP